MKFFEKLLAELAAFAASAGAGTASFWNSYHPKSRKTRAGNKVEGFEVSRSRHLETVFMATLLLTVSKKRDTMN